MLGTIMHPSPDWFLPSPPDAPLPTAVTDHILRLVMDEHSLLAIPGIRVERFLPSKDMTPQFYDSVPLLEVARR